jgi:hypothetical protein
LGCQGASGETGNRRYYPSFPSPLSQPYALGRKSSFSAQSERRSMMESLAGYPNELLLLLVIIIIAQFVVRLIAPKTKK